MRRQFNLSKKRKKNRFQFDHKISTRIVKTRESDNETPCTQKSIDWLT